MLAAKSLHKRLGERDILADVSVTVRPGEFVAIIGANGAGKSTLMKILSGELAADSGTVHLLGEDVASTSASRLAAMRAVVPQSAEMAFPFTAYEIVRLGAEAGGALNAQHPQICLAALEQVDLAAMAGRLVPTLSGGEAQRVYLARAIAQLMAMKGAQRFLFMDEPTSSLDLQHQVHAIRIGRKLAGQGVGVLAILHDLNLASLAATRIVALCDGKVIADGEPAKVVDDTLIRRLYNIDIGVNATPGPDKPFVLPQAATER
ncbi:heme ABC transporter ATP-binding protein [Aureimonas fodinaquatilis]|uniref:Heme ABC transporter ATP-binding protein n=1 Tax=Aureimonas fodinaquatilis TaxID=2565783 RepID=A0A5B0DR50_9HYPH|nr:heme ABC transporter ATP-binding protein [Aureimonas fodinaquatilis]KAA0968475.1 heme ABC transporter ATP-binding protein [Aureimonas fodinaquatilis]